MSSFFGDIRTMSPTFESGVKKAYVDPDITYKSDGSIAVCFEDLGSKISNGVSYGISILGNDSNNFGGKCPLIGGQACPHISRDDGSSGACCKLPSMVINYSDPPLTDFTWNGEVYPFELFANEKRGDCKKDIFGNWSCNSRVSPGSTILHEFMHVLGANHEHLNPAGRFEYNVPKVYDTLCPTGDPDCINSVDRNWLGTQGCEGCVSETEYDPYSIMTYSIPQEFILSGSDGGIHNNYVLSELDKQWLNTKYPPDSMAKPTIQVRFGNGREWQKSWFQKLTQENFGNNVNLEFVEADHIECGVNTPPADMPLEQILILVGLVLGSIAGLWFLGRFFFYIRKIL